MRTIHAFCAGAIAALVGCASAPYPVLPEGTHLKGAPRATPPPANELTRDFDYLDALLATYERASFDPIALAKTLGTPEAAVAWVRAHTRLVAYRGSLRGARGVLLDHVGNALDRALLTAELLRALGARVRLANATLDDVHLGLVAVAARRPAVAPPEDSWSPPAGFDDIAAAAAESAAQSEPARVALANEGRTTTARVFEEVSKAVALPAVGLAPSFDALRDHWWVQVEHGGRWDDVDATDGAPFAGLSAAHTVPLDRADADPLDPKLLHRVEVRVVVERWEGGRFVESVPLTHTLVPAELIGQGVQLGYVPRDPALRLEPSAADGLRAALMSEREWLPVLRVGDKTFAHEGFDDHGALRAQDGHAANQAGAKASDALGLLGQSGQASASGVLTAAWLEFTIITPDAAPVTTRREVFDLIGPDRRHTPPAQPPAPSAEGRLARAIALSGVTDLALVAAQPSVDALAFFDARALAAERPLWTGDDAGAAAYARAKRPVRPTNAAWSLALQRAAAGELGTTAYLDRPNVIAATRYLVSSDPRTVIGAQLTTCQSLDIIANDVAVFPEAADRALAVRMRQGVADTDAEARIGTLCGPGENPIRLEAAAPAANSKGWVTLRSPRDPALAALAVEPDVRQRIADDLARGDIVVAPAARIQDGGAARYAWWRIDPKTGRTLGIDSHGHGGEMLEYLELLDYALSVLDATLCSMQAGSNLRAQRECMRGFARAAAVGFVAGGAAFYGKPAKVAVQVIDLMGIRMREIMDLERERARRGP